MTIYTNGTGSYFAIQAQAPDHTYLCTRRGNVDGCEFYDAISVATAPDPAWTVAPNLTDIGAGIWVSGSLQDPA